MPFVEGGEGKRPRRRWSSWYDNRLVTEAGEAILAELDSWAIEELRRYKLVWSGWGPLQKLNDFDPIPNTDWGFREISGMDFGRLRLFFLSLLWRACASDRPEFELIQMDREELERLRKMIVAKNSDPFSFYPISLVQLSTMGITHNHTPILETKRIEAFDDQPDREVSIFRFYFDGLIVHCERPRPDVIDIKEFGKMTIGFGDKLAVMTVTFEGSRQKALIEHFKAEAMTNWPDVMQKL